MKDYIVFEGADGTGKSTLSKLFAERIGAHWTYEPNGDDEITKQLRSFCLSGQYKEMMNWRVREYLLLASRAKSTFDVMTLLSQDKKVVSDRSLISGAVYAMVASNMMLENWWDLAKNAFWTLPEVVVYVETENQKIVPKGDDIYDNEKEEFHKRIKETFPEVLKKMGDFLELDVIVFKNNFNLSPEENLNLLMKEF